MESKSFLRWAGSKKKLLPILSRQFPLEYNQYIEPFVGSAQLFFAMNPTHAVLGDTNEDLIHCYMAVRDHPEEVFKNLQSFPEGKEAYYEIRAADTSLWEAQKRAAQFIYLNTYCFNGLYRTNKQGKFNVPYSNSSSKLHTYDHLLMISESLHKVTFAVGDFEMVIKRHIRPNDIVYLDPPYAVRNKDMFVQYGPETFGLSDIERLKECLYIIDSMDATFLMSYADCEESNEIAQRWNHKIVSTVRNISGFAKHRKQENEILISNKPFND